MTTPPPAAMTMARLIRHVSERATSDLPPEVAARIAALAPRFDAAVAELPAAPLNVVVFHLTLPDEHRHIDYVDIKSDQGATDYRPVLQHSFAMARGYNPACRIVYITGERDETDFVPGDVTVVRLPLDPGRLMYERVVAINAFMQSKAFAAHTVFLDSDAFINCPMDRVFRLSFDVAVTFREDTGMMPLNEGVIFAGCNPGLAARGFFRRYLATYEALCGDPLVLDIYKEIRRWRGGQLSLNAASAATGLISEIDQRMVAGALVRYLHCNDYNFFVRDKTYAFDLLRRKYILHLKGPMKVFLAQISQPQIAWLREHQAAAAPQAAPAPAEAPLRHVAPVFSLINKEYNTPPFSVPETRQRFAGQLQGAMEIMGANRPGSGAAAVDDMLVWFRNIGFLEQPDFIEAFRPYHADPVLRARIWRVYMLCWAARSCLRLPGDFMDVGCYDGRTVEVMERYCDFRAAAGKTWWLYDMFENPPDEARKASHGPRLFDTVRQAFEPLGNFRVIKGAVPGSFAQGIPERVAFAQLDLNVAAPELAALEVIYDRMVPGGIIIFDDFGFRRYRESHDAELAFLQARGDLIWESPTGQGLFIKR